LPDELLTRTFQLRLAHDDAAGRIVEGLCVPYNVENLVSDRGADPYLEVFTPGAFARAVRAPNRVTFRFRHGEGLSDWIGQARSFAETDAELTGAFRVTESAFGDHALALVDDGIIRGLSVGFVPLGRREHRTASGAIIRDRCHLAEVSLVPEPAYVGAVVTGRREQAARSPTEIRAVSVPEIDPDVAARLRAVGVSL
jgi:HK97 family phage prohead protease